jgi:hypothetical protein
MLTSLSACGGNEGATSATPVTPTPVVPSSPAAKVWSVAGQIVATGSQQPVAGASLTPGWALAGVLADAEGNYELGDAVNPPSTPFPITISGSGFLSHDVWVTWQRGPRVNVMLDLIRDSAPFSADFYGQLVRGRYDQPGAPWPILRWTTAPKFYVRTVDQNGRAIEPEVLVSVLDGIRRAVPAWSAGRMNVAALETGTDTRPAVPDWINVDIRRDPKEDRICGTARLGANPGSIILNDDVCSCGSNKIPGAVTMHEVGHAMGFFHVGDRKSLMFPFVAGDCPAGALSAAESYHAGIAYSRPRGNREPDQDPPSAIPFVASTPDIRVH